MYCTINAFQYIKQHFADNVLGRQRILTFIEESQLPETKTLIVHVIDRLLIS